MAFRHIGKPAPRKDGNDIVTGKATFLRDFSLPGMLYVKVLRSPHSFAEIVSIDTSKAEAMDGVKAVLTYKDAPENWRAGMPVHRKVLDKIVRCVGDGVALVAATTENTAEAALDLIDVKYELLTPVYDPDEAIKPCAPQIWEQFPNNTFPPGCWQIDHGDVIFDKIVMGDVNKAFEECTLVIKDKYTYNAFPSPLAPESPGVIVRWDDEDEITVWATSQSPNIMKLFGMDLMPDVKMTVNAFNVGGSYGNKQHMSNEFLYAALAAKATHQPAMCYLSKTEHLLTFDQRLGNTMELKIGVLEDGSIHAIQGDWIVDTGMSSVFAQGESEVGLGEAQLVTIKCKNWDLKTKIVCTNRVLSGMVRGFGGQELKSILIPLCLKAMKELNIDPVQGFIKNLVSEGDEYIWRDGKPQTCVGVNYTKAIEETAKAFGWENKWKGWNKPSSVKGNKVVGVGVGVHANADAGEDDSEALIKLEHDGTVLVECLVGESGMGQRNAACTFAAEVMNVPLKNVKITPMNTLLNPKDFGLAGSRGTRTIGTAVHNAAMDAKRQLLERGANAFGVPVDAVDTEDGFIFLKELPEKRMPWIAVLSPMESIVGKGVFKENFQSPNFFIMFVEVEIDLETGQADIINVVGGSDIGQIIDPIAVKMQCHGTFGSAGTDTGLYEGHVFDTYTGHVMTGNMIDYKWRPFNDFPEFETVLLESGYDFAPFKGIGVGEITGSAGPAAVLMAISNAIGVEMHEYPLTPDKILKALGKA